MELLNGKLSGRREAKVGMDVVHMRGEVYKHGVESGSGKGEALCDLPRTYMWSAHSTKKETFGA